MKFLLVSSSDALQPFLERSFSHQAAEVIHYDNPIKAMDNLDEIEPDVVFFAAVDFPRHWKPFVTYLRNTYSRRESVFILLIPDSFSEEEANKAEHLEVNAVLDEDLTSRRTVEQVRAIITRYHRMKDIRKFSRVIPNENDHIDFLFTNPYTFHIVRGRVLDLSSGGLRFEPWTEKEARTIDPFSVVSAASLRVGTRIIPVRVRVVRVQRSIGFEFVDLEIDDESTIIDYLDGRAERDLHAAIERASDTLDPETIEKIVAASES